MILLLSIQAMQFETLFRNPISDSIANLKITFCEYLEFLAPFKRGPGLYFAISPSQHSVPARSWRPACLCLCLCRGCTVCCWLPFTLPSSFRLAFLNVR